MPSKNDLVARVRSGLPEKQIDIIPSQSHHDFDPVKKISSVLSRSKPLSGRMFFDGGKYHLPGQSDADKYSPGVFSLLQFLASGLEIGDTHLLGRISRRDRRYYFDDDERTPISTERFVSVLRTAENEHDAVIRLSLMRIRNHYLANTSQARRDPSFYNIVKLPLEGIAHSLAMDMYERETIRKYYKHRGIPETDIIPVTPDNILAERDEEYQQPGKGLVGLNPETLIAAHILYSHLHGLEERLKTVQKTFDLILLVGSRFYQTLIQNTQISQKTDNALLSNHHFRKVFFSTVAYYHMSLIEGGKYDK